MSDQPGNPYGSTPGEGEDNPNPYGQPSDTPYGQPPTYGQQPPQDPYGLPPTHSQPGQNPYGKPQQNPYGAAPDYPQPGFQQPNYGMQQKEPQATTALVLGIVGLSSIVFCVGVLLILSPFAWSLGSKSLKEIEASRGALGGADQARAGMIMGIIGTVILVLGILAIAALVAVAIASAGSSNY